MVVLSSVSPIGSIVLIGPTGVGKSVVGTELAALLGWPLVELDDMRERWYPEFGLDVSGEHDAWQRGGLLELVATWKPYELLSVERVMREHPANTVIAFGGGQSVYVDPAMIDRAHTALSPASRVILMLPAERGEDSIRILQERLAHVPFVTGQPDPAAFLRAFAPILKMQLQSESNRQLATELIVTGHSTPQELARHIATTMEVG